MLEKNKRFQQQSNATTRAQSNLQIIMYSIRIQSILICSFILSGRKFSLKKFILNIVIVVTMLPTFLPNLLVESNLSCLGKC